MTLTILTARWKLFLLKLKNVSLTQIWTLSSEWYIVCLILRLMFSMTVYLMWWMLSRKSGNFVICWEIWILLMTTKQQENYLMYYIVIMYFLWSRVTSTTATLIDHILTNKLDDDMMHIQGILYTSISDHYAIFHVANNAEKDHAKTDTPFLKRNMCQRNITKFITEMNMIDWQFVLNETDTQSAYTKVHEEISTKYNACFPYRKISKKYYKNEPWLSTALKESIKIKNKLYVKSKRSNEDENVSFYKKYRSKLNQLIRTAERKHFHDILLEHKSNLRKSWQVIKAVINKRKYTPVNYKFKVNGTTTNEGNVIANKFNTLL